MVRTLCAPFVLLLAACSATPRLPVRTPLASTARIASEAPIDAEVPLAARVHQDDAPRMSELDAAPADNAQDLDDEPFVDEFGTYEERSGGWHGHVGIPLGAHLGDRELGDARDLANVGLVDFDIRPHGSPVALVAQVLIAYTDSVPDDSPGSPFEEGDYTVLSQLNLGLRLAWRSGNWRPFIGGGVAFVDASVGEDRRHHDDDEIAGDSDVGAWFGGGFHYSPGGPIYMGIMGQYLADTDVELEGRSVDVGGWDVLLVVGYAW